MPKRREKILSLFGPLSLFVLLMVWAGVLILGYALMYWAAIRRLSPAVSPLPSGLICI